MSRNDHTSVVWRKEQRSRETQEDRYSVLSPCENRLVLGVFDGHNGSEAAEWCASNMLEILNDLLTIKNPYMAFESAFKEANQEMREVVGRSGCTASIVLLEENFVFTANVGDSRVVLARNGEAVELTVSHYVKDIKASELRRVRQSGAIIHRNAVNGLLNVTRALGDYAFQPAVSPMPEISFTVFREEVDTALIIATDGLWDSVSPQEAVTAINGISDPEEMLLKLVNLSAGGKDNATIGIVLLQGRAPDSRKWLG